VRNYFEVKQTGTVQDVDLKSRTVTGYFSKFDNVDSDGDMIVYGAFTKTIKERGQDGANLIIHLADHIFKTDNLLGKPKLWELKGGGYFETTFSHTAKANDVLNLYRDGVINQHSFGFQTIKADNKKDYREIREVKIYEISSVVLGANDQTPFTGFKSYSKQELFTQYKTLKSAFDNGTYTDDMFQLLDAQIKQLEQEILAKTLAQPEPERASTQSGGIDIVSLAAAKETLLLNLLNL